MRRWRERGGKRQQLRRRDKFSWRSFALLLDRAGEGKKVLFVQNNWKQLNKLLYVYFSSQTSQLGALISSKIFFITQKLLSFAFAENSPQHIFRFLSVCVSLGRYCYAPRQRQQRGKQIVWWRVKSHQFAVSPERANDWGTLLRLGSCRKTTQRCWQPSQWLMQLWYGSGEFFTVSCSRLALHTADVVASRMIPPKTLFD